MSLKYISAKAATQIDKELMSSTGFSIDQLMELAGLSVAETVYKTFPKNSRVLVLVGPGNNGGDGLVAARHLKNWGYDPSVIWPKRKNSTLFNNFELQLKDLRIDIKDYETVDFNAFELIIDGLFGFSFDPSNGIREPFGSIIEKINKSDKVPILSIDIPSGWDVDNGRIGENVGIRDPDVLISLTAPKSVIKYLEPTRTRHFVGGRFISTDFAKRHGLERYEFTGSEQSVEVNL